MEVRKVISHNLKALRQYYNQSQSDLAELTGIDKGRISKYENMKVEIRITTLYHIAKCYRINVLFLLIYSNESFDIWHKLATDTYREDEQTNYISRVLEYLERY